MTALADVDALLHSILTAVGVKHLTEVGPDLYQRMPLVVAYRASGAAVHPELLDRATVFAQAWAGNKGSAYALALDVRLALFRAWRNQIKYSTGVVNHYSEVSGPSEIRGVGQPDNAWRYDATYSITIRPSS